MARRRTTTSRTREALPAGLAAGPCIEVWCPPAPVPAYIAEDDRGTVRAARALREWGAAVTAWAVASGWADDDRPAHRAKDLARARWPWSRDYLTATGEAALVDYYEGRTDEHPGRLASGWQASF